MRYQLPAPAKSLISTSTWAIGIFTRHWIRLTLVTIHISQPIRHWLGNSVTMWVPKDPCLNLMAWWWTPSSFKLKWDRIKGTRGKGLQDKVEGTQVRDIPSFRPRTLSNWGLSRISSSSRQFKVNSYCPLRRPQFIPLWYSLTGQRILKEFLRRSPLASISAHRTFRSSERRLHLWGIPKCWWITAILSLRCRASKRPKTIPSWSIKFQAVGASSIISSTALKRHRVLQIGSPCKRIRNYLVIAATLITPNKTLQGPSIRIQESKFPSRLASSQGSICKSYRQSHLKAPRRRRQLVPPWPWSRRWPIRRHMAM